MSVTDRVENPTGTLQMFVPGKEDQHAHTCARTFYGWILNPESGSL